MSVQFTRGCAVQWGIFSTLVDIIEYTGGGVFSTPGKYKYTGGVQNSGGIP